MTWTYSEGSWPAVLQVTNGSTRIAINYDEWAESPRSWDNVGTFYIWDRDVSSPDECDYSSFDAWRVEWDEADDADAVAIPVRCQYLGANGSRYRVSEWDEANGVIFATGDKVRAEWGDSDDNLSQAYGVLTGEIATYEEWANGNVYTFTVFNRSECECCHNVEWNALHSVSGFYAVSDALSEAHSYCATADDVNEITAVLPSYYRDGN